MDELLLKLQAFTESLNLMPEGWRGVWYDQDGEYVFSVDHDNGYWWMHQAELMCKTSIGAEVLEWDTWRAGDRVFVGLHSEEHGYLMGVCVKDNGSWEVAPWEDDTSDDSE